MNKILQQKIIKKPRRIIITVTFLITKGNRCYFYRPNLTSQAHIYAQYLVLFIQPFITYLTRFIQVNTDWYSIDIQSNIAKPIKAKFA